MRRLLKHISQCPRAMCMLGGGACKEDLGEGWVKMMQSGVTVRCGASSRETRLENFYVLSGNTMAA